MEEFEHMVVDEFNEEDFYEQIEAPKFVDLTAPDHRPEGDDRYWFCSRVGCDQKHEEFMDSEAIYKNFVLRVMAARSPSVRLRKALYRKDSSVDPKCPNTVPAKPSRSRVSRLAMISSIPHKANGETKPVMKVVSTTNKNATPKKAVVPKKALTEQRKKQMQSPAGFRSVQNARTAMVKQSENRVVAKALVFHSPKKVVKLKRSVELSSSVKKLCSGVRKLEIENKRNGLGVNRKVVTPVPASRPLRTRREVKSRVFDSVRLQKKIGEKVKENVKGKEEPLVSSDRTKALEANGMECKELLVENKENALALECGNKENATNAADVDRLDKATKHENVVIEDKENATNVEDVDRESDDKENSLALDNNRKVDQDTSLLSKKKVFIKKETCKTIQKAMTTVDKCFNGKNVSSNTRVKYTKPKLTNPKPFRLRTDERRILKEANTEKKPQCDLAKEEETTNILGENLVPKHQPVRLEKKNTTSSRLKAFKGTSTTTLSRHNNASKEVATIINKPSLCGVASGEKRHVTIPKGPNFHSVHVPKSCTKRVASQTPIKSAF